MPPKYYVLPEEREDIMKEALKQAAINLNGPVAFYESWPGEDARLTVVNDIHIGRHPFLVLVCEDETRAELCRQDYERRAANCREPQISLSRFGFHDALCPIEDEHEAKVILIGGVFLVRERKDEARNELERFLEAFSSEEKDELRKAWGILPEVNEKEVLSHTIRELELVGRSYLHALKQRSDFRYSADLATHDVVIAMQALIADIEVLKIELKEAFGIGRKWERRFESLIRLCVEHITHLEARLNLDKPRYIFEPIAKLIHECIDPFIPKAKARGLAFRVNLRAGREEEVNQTVVIRMNRAALRQALRNALDNAVKYSFAGTDQHPRWIEVIGEPQEVQGAAGYKIVVINFGVGIEKDEIDLVFEPGYQGRRRIDESRSGYGMGLTFVKDCIEQHGGSVTIQSLPQQATGWLTTLNIWLPIQGPLGRDQSGD